MYDPEICVASWNLGPEFLVGKFFRRRLHLSRITDFGMDNPPRLSTLRGEDTFPRWTFGAFGRSLRATADFLLVWWRHSEINYPKHIAIQGGLEALG